MTDFIIFLGEQWILVSILMVLVFLFIQSESKRGGQRVSVHQLTSLVNQENALILDIRDSADYREGHIVDAMNIPYSKIKEHLGELESYKGNPIVVVDKMGQHSGSIGKQLNEAGFNASRLEGGMTEWKASSLPVVKN